MHLKKLSLQNFRRFGNESFDFDDLLNIIIGENAIGKSSILEAIALITDGYSPWTSDLNEIIQREELFEIADSGSFFRIEAIISDMNKDISLAYFHSKEKKKFIIDGKATSRKKFFRFTSTNIFSPEQIELLMISPSKRREYLNRIISRIDLDYQEQLETFDKVLRQRNAYLKKLSKIFLDTGVLNIEDKLLHYWTYEFAKINARLVKLRSDYIDRISKISDGFVVKYKPSIILEDFAILQSEEKLANDIFEILYDKIKRDIILGYSNLGIHRDDWNIKTNKDIQKFGSRGEKRTALSKMIFEVQELHFNELGYYPILILDDINSELDDKNIETILSKENLSKQQVFITSIRKDENIRKLENNSENSFKEFIL